MLKMFRNYHKEIGVTSYILFLYTVLKSFLHKSTKPLFTPHLSIYFYIPHYPSCKHPTQSLKTFKETSILYLIPGLNGNSHDLADGWW